MSTTDRTTGALDTEDAPIDVISNWMTQNTAQAIGEGRLSGPHVDTLPWIRKARHLLDIRVSTIELVPDGDGHRLRVGDAVRLRATRSVEDNAAVSCLISGYERIGLELRADELVVNDDPFAWELSGNCAFAAEFEYAS